MEDQSLRLDMQQIRHQLRKEQDKYVLAIAADKDTKELRLIKDRIVTLQKQLENMASGGYRGL
jgi:hypothetical protein